MRTVVIALLALAGAAGCSPVELPEPESPGAVLYRERCVGCHALFPPQRLTPAMWEFQVLRMQGEMARRGFAPLSADEIDVLLAYLKRHSANPEE